MSGPALHQPLDAAGLLTTHDRRVALIRQAANEAREADYIARWHDVLARCAAWFSSLPYSPLLYREPGGAFRCTVETAFYAMRLAGGQKFGTNLPSEKRRLIEPQYNHAVFLAAVCSGLDEPYRHFEVMRHSDRAQWNPAGHGALANWLAGSTYSLQRRATPLPVERMRTALFAQNLIGHELLAGYEAEVLSQLFGAINPLAQAQANESLVHKVVRQAVAVAADFDRKAQQAVYAPVPYPVPAATHVAAAVQPVVTPSPAPVAPAPAADPAPAPAATTPDASGRQPVAQAVVDPPSGTSPLPATQPAAGAVQAATSAPVAPATTPSLPASGSPDGTAKATMPTKHDPQLGLPFSGDAPPSVAVDPSAVRVPATRGAAAALPATFDQVLDGQPNMIREFFRALREDVAAGKAKVEWTDKGLAIPKRLAGSFGVASDTLIDHLRRRGLLVSNVQAEIVLAARAGELIMERSES
ncbi:TraI domain-containing protein [Paraburkholderia sp. CNPSo 3076]|uniref:TraI domain-containing protein n=1 Tax=Paraburkholderia sp. CNPSo 3076 TaxID=2940936 RepID=UPI0022571C03|nr:TraI domain-containing protein [Paraburkholderia sp. CNPSo 3076]MCX5545410.1 TraI domain-containing protein [Paraburkholderia sp. CNPSo 3076]